MGNQSSIANHGQIVVQTSVDSNLKEQFKSYSEAAAVNVVVCHADTLTGPATLKKVVKSVSRKRI